MKRLRLGFEFAIISADRTNIMRKASIILISILVLIACSTDKKNIDTPQGELSAEYDGIWKGEAIPEVYSSGCGRAEMKMAIRDRKINGRATVDGNVIYKIGGFINEENEVILKPVTITRGAAYLAVDENSTSRLSGTWEAKTTISCRGTWYVNKF